MAECSKDDCSLDATERSSECILHAHPDEHPFEERDSKKHKGAIMDAIRDVHADSTGMHVPPGFAFPGDRINVPVQLTNSTFHGNVDFSEVTFESSVSLDYCYFA
jgi:hypothetical protein